MGLGAMTTGVFLNEISTVALRGPVSGCNMTSNVLGILCYTSLCIVLPIQWLALPLAANCFLVIGLLLLLPESPQWLMRQGREDEAKESLGSQGESQPLDGEDDAEGGVAEDAPM